MSISDSINQLSDIKSSKTYRTDLIKTTINSTLSFILAFWFIYFINQAVSIATANVYSIPAVLHTYRIFWPLYTYSTLYTRQALILIFGTGPLVCLILALVFYRVYRVLRKRRINLKVLVLWMVFHGLNMFFGAYVVGVITRTGFIYTTEWIFYSNVFDIEEIIFMLISLIVLIIVGFVGTRQFIMATNAANIINPRNRILYILGQVFLPWLIGNLLLFIFNFPNNPPELLLLYAVSFLMIVPAFTNFNMPSNKIINVKMPKSGLKTAWIYILLVIVFALVLRTMVYQGITFS